MKRFISVAVAFSFSALSAGVASAQITQQSSAATGSASVARSEPLISDVDGPSYVVQFEMDGLDAMLEDGTIPRIAVRPVHTYGQLLRPRLHFVPELLKSVEIM